MLPTLWGRGWSRGWDLGLGSSGVGDWVLCVGAREGRLPGGEDVGKELLEVGKAERVRSMLQADSIAYANAQGMSLTEGL